MTAATGRLAALVALAMCALALRPQLIGVGPLLPQIQTDLAISHGIAGLLGAIPVLCMGLFAPPAALLAGELGARRAIGVCLVAIAAFGVGRVVVPEAWGVILLTFGVGAGMGVAGTLLPVAVKERFPDRPAFATGVYATAIQIGAALSAAVAVPLADLTIGWRGPLLIFSLVSALIAVAWFYLTRDSPAHRRLEVRPPRLPLTSATAWLLVAIFFLQATTYYGINSWLPATYVEAGWAERQAGTLLAVLHFAALPASLALPYAADRIGSRRWYLVVASGSVVLGTLGVVLAPTAAWAWVLLLGVGLGAMFPLVLTLPLDVSDRPADVGAVAGLMLGAGYALSAVSPVGLGLIRDLTGSFATSMWLMVVTAGLLVLSVTFVSGERLHHGIGRRASHRSG